MASGLPGPDLSSVTAKLAKAVAESSTEEDLRVRMEHILHEALPDLQSAKYEKSVKTSTFKGRADAVHHGLVIEYEKPGSMSSEKHREHAVKQVCDYLTGLGLGQEGKHQQPNLKPSLFDSDVVYTQEEEERLAVNVGLATDGSRFIFVQRLGKHWHTEPRRLDEDTVEKLLIWLRAMVRKDLSPENLIEDFGHETQVATEVVRVLAKLVDSQKYPKANVIYGEWQRIFGIVYGTEQLERTKSSDKTKALASAYQIKVDGGFPVVLFAVHTYYALLMKMLATEVIVAQGGLGDTFIGTLTRGGLRDQLGELESGGVLQRHNIRNAIEQDFFGWYPEAWTEELQDALWRMTQALAAYDIGTFQIKPDRARDLLKDLYHGLIPESVRHALGEYYTPDWLAEHTINLAGYEGDPRKTLLDPSCGSGTFLVMAILKARQWLADRMLEWNSNEKKLEAVNLIRHNIVGFDLNPLAVIAARTNYLFALGPLLRYRGAGHDFEVPVYLTDSVLLPGKAKQQANLFAQDTVPFPMTVGTFDLPMEVIEKHRVRDLMNLLHDCIAEGHNRDAFVNRSIKELHLTDQKKLRVALGSLFDQMATLDSQGKNRVWAKLIRNRYAALFFRHHFDFVVGNPPHVNWEALTTEWRKAAEEEYKSYGMFTLTGHEGRHGGGKKDIAALFTYAVMDHFVKPGGVLALVVHVSLFKTSGAGEGYRRFQLGNKECFCVEEAHDFASFQPFQTHAKMKIKTRTLSFRAVKGKQTKYPVPYNVWTKTTKGFIPGGLTWPEAEKRLAMNPKTARPLRGTDKTGLLTPWLTISEKEYALCKKVIAPTGYVPQYAGHAGAFTGGLNGAYFVEILERYPNGTVLVRNEHDTGKIECPQVQTTIEADLLYPLLRGRSIGRWRYSTSGHMLIVQDPNTRKGYSESWMQETHPLTWAYLKKFEALLRKRKAITKVYDLNKDPFYTMYAVAPYTFSPYKVAWMDVSATVKATAIVSGSGNDMPLPEHGVIFLTTESVEEAYYVAGVLNSESVGTIISGYIVDNHLSTHPIKNITIPAFDATDSTHHLLVESSRKAHAAAAQDDIRGVAEAEKAINKVIDSLW
jgi:N-6 DNA Methylase